MSPTAQACAYVLSAGVPATVAAKRFVHEPHHHRKGQVMTTREVLLAAADEIERSGLHKGWFWTDNVWGDGPCCVKGALLRAVRDIGDDRHRVHAIASDYFDDYMLSVGAIPKRKTAAVFNDLPTTTATDVIAALRAAADSVREGR